MPWFKKKEEKAPPPKDQKPAAKAEKPPEKAPAKEPEKAPAPAPKAPETPAAAKTPDDVAGKVHRGLVETGLTIDGTREVFKKRLAEKYGSVDEFARRYGKHGAKSVTRFVAFWLGFEAPERFEPDRLLYDANQRLSSFHIQVTAGEVVSVDDSRGVRETTLTVGDTAVEVQFQTPRDVIRAINDLVKEKGVRFLELETWGDGFAFMLARKVNWDRIAAADVVVVKAEETARGGDCPECGSRVGELWSTCIACNTALAKAA